MNNPFAVLFGVIVLIKVVELLFNIPSSTQTHDSPLRSLEEELDDSPTYLNDPLGDPRPQGAPLYH